MLVGFAGMTHLGIVSAAAAAGRGFDVIGYDADAALIDALTAGRLPIVEPGLGELLAKSSSHIEFAAVPARLGRCDIVYVSADVPTDEEARSDLAPIRALVAAAADNLREDALLVVLCQVPPGFTRSLRSPPPERRFYQVETLIFGRAVERAVSPERFILGCADPDEPLPRRYSELLDAFGCPVLPMRYESAELAKISINFCLVASVTVANMLAEVSEKIGADWLEIVPALQLDRRIGRDAYLRPGLGIAGGNLERDLRTVLEIGAATGAHTDVISGWLANSRHRKDWCWHVLRERLLARHPDARVAVLGLAYKEGTHSVKNSPSLALIEMLGGRNVRVHDPVVPASAAPSATRSASPLACAEGADALVIATPWHEYRGLAFADLRRAMSGRLLIDPFRVLDPREAARAGFEYHALGMPPLPAS
jgi:UDPglucose 6-dehydrogenase